MGFLERLEARAAAVGGRVVLAEGHDQRVIDAAGELIAGGGCDVTLLCPSDQRQPAHDQRGEWAKRFAACWVCARRRSSPQACASASADGFIILIGLIAEDEVIHGSLSRSHYSHGGK